MTRHQFLEQLHLALRPETYLEVGVQHGPSLALAERAKLAIGIDPIGTQVFHAQNARNNQRIIAGTSDEFFAQADRGISLLPDRQLRIDLAFIDGMHLFEFALRDFCNIEKYCHGGSVVVFDDVLPRNQHEARRMAPGDPVYGDWTGDVWKVHPFLNHYHDRPYLHYRLVDTQPTGVLVVAGFPDVYQPWSPAGDMIEQAAGVPAVPPDVINRTDAWQPAVALAQIEKEITLWRS